MRTRLIGRTWQQAGFMTLPLQRRTEGIYLSSHFEFAPRCSEFVIGGYSKVNAVFHILINLINREGAVVNGYFIF